MMLIFIIIGLIIKCCHWYIDVLTFWFDKTLEEGAKLIKLII